MNRKDSKENVTINKHYKESNVTINKRYKESDVIVNKKVTIKLKNRISSRNLESPDKDSPVG